MSTGASAIMIEGTEVGAVDTFIDSALLRPSNPATEEDWVQSVLGDPTITFAGKTEGGFSFLNNPGESVYAFDLLNEPDYYLLKLGQGATASGDSHFLFQNLADLVWAVFDLGISAIGAGDNPGIVSHISEFCIDGECGGNEVPEPGVLGLLGLGLISLVVARRRKTA
jgi:hypothetical protein